MYEGLCNDFCYKNAISCLMFDIATCFEVTAHSVDQSV